MPRNLGLISTLLWLCRICIPLHLLKRPKMTFYFSLNIMTQFIEILGKFPIHALSLFSLLLILQQTRKRKRLMSFKLRYAGRLFVRSSSRPSEVLVKLNEMVGFSSYQELELYEVSFHIIVGLTCTYL